MTREQRDALRALANAATPGPWPGHYVRGAVRHIARNVDRYAFCFADGAEQPDFCWDHYADAPFIAAAHPNAVVALLDALDAAEAKLARVEAITGPADVGVDCYAVEAFRRRLRAALAGEGDR